MKTYPLKEEQEPRKADRVAKAPSKDELELSATLASPDQQLTEEILNLHIQGVLTPQIAHQLGVEEEQVDRYITIALDGLTSYFGKPSAAHSFIRYAAFHLGLIGELDGVIKLCKGDAKAAPARVNAIKAKGEMYDKIYRQGISCGIIREKESERALEINGAGDQVRLILKREVEEVSMLLARMEPATYSVEAKKTPIPPRLPAKKIKVRSAVMDDNGLPIMEVPHWSSRPSTSNSYLLDLREVAIRYASLKAIKEQVR